MKIKADLATFSTFLGPSPAAAWYLWVKKATWQQQGTPEVNAPLFPLALSCISETSKLPSVCSKW